MSRGTMKEISDLSTYTPRAVDIAQQYGDITNYNTDLGPLGYVLMALFGIAALWLLVSFFIYHTVYRWQCWADRMLMKPFLSWIGDAILGDSLNFAPHPINNTTNTTTGAVKTLNFTQNNVNRGGLVAGEKEHPPRSCFFSNDTECLEGPYEEKYLNIFEMNHWRRKKREMELQGTDFEAKSEKSVETT
jgi:hypothetical protein